jgi:hypothetical protein
VVIEAAARGAQFLLAIGIAYIIALWFALVAWTFRDIEARSRSVFTQVFSTLLVVLFFVPGLLLYLILRPKETLDQAFQRALEEEYLLQDLDELELCPGCQRAVEAEFILCPHCKTHLRGPCPSCSRLIDLRWSVCPYCAVAVDAAAIEAPAATAQPLPLREGGREGRRKRAVAAAAQRVGIAPEELDAFTDALSAPGSTAAVGAGETAHRESPSGDLLAAPLRGFRDRLGQFGFGAQERHEPDGDVTLTRLPDEDNSSSTSGFWADPVQGVARGRRSVPRDES